MVRLPAPADKQWVLTRVPLKVGRNVCHGSDSVENAKKEIALWFGEKDLVSYKPSQFDWIYEKA
jgi:nucleoside-diphosphate kinase